MFNAFGPVVNVFFVKTGITKSFPPVNFFSDFGGSGYLDIGGRKDSDTVRMVVKNEDGKKGTINKQH